MPVTIVPKPLDENTLLRMLRYALQTGGTTLHLAPGRRPWLEGLGPLRELRHRQLTVEDTRAAAACFLAQSRVPERLTRASGEAASLLYLFWELSGEALIEPRFESLPRGGLALHLDVIPRLPDDMGIELLEP